MLLGQRRYGRGEIVVPPVVEQVGRVEDHPLSGPGELRRLRGMHPVLGGEPGELDVHLLGALQRGAASVLVGRELAAPSLQVCSPGPRSGRRWPGRRWPGRRASRLASRRACLRVSALGWRDFIGLDAPFPARADAAQRLAEVTAALGEHGAHARVVAVHGGEPHRKDRGSLPDRVDDPVVRPGGSLQPGQVLKVAAQGRFAVGV
jgi:hypothetical protein